jgi:hypothetical protein
VCTLAKIGLSSVATAGVTMLVLDSSAGAAAAGVYSIRSAVACLSQSLVKSCVLRRSIVACMTPLITRNLS